MSITTSTSASISIASSDDHDEENPSTTSNNENSPLLGPSHQRVASLQSDLHAINALPGMQIRAYQIGRKHGTFSSCTSGEALAGAKTGGKKHYFWLDIDAGPEDSDELRAWLHRLNLPNFVVDVLAESSETWASQVIPLKRACLAVIRILPHNTGSDHMTHVAALALRNMLITFTSCPRKDTGGLFAQAMTQMNEAERLPSATSSGALIGWLRFHLDRTSRSTRELRYSVLAMDESMDRHISSVKIEEIIAAKDQLLRLLSVAEEQSECLQALSAASTGADGFDLSDLTGSLGSLVATAGATERSTLRLEKHIAELRKRAEEHEHKNMNSRLGFLTVLSAIFLPLTLLTGIWGMNFSSMPELSQPNAYPMALVFMFCLASLMIYYFRKSGYFD
jgi:Mg2+ and Co2+ transporter CorA